jgi:putative ABC transport system permease protein
MRAILAMGIDPTANVFDIPDIDRQTSALLSPRNLLLDTKTKGKDFGARNGRQFSSQDLQTHVEVWDKEFKIVGLFELGAGLAANGSVVMSSAGYGRFFPTDTVNNVNYGLVDLKPGVDAAAFCEELRQNFSRAGTPPDGTAKQADGTAKQPPVAVLTRDEVRKLEQERWIWYTPVGAIFVFGVVVALVVGAVVVYMVLSNDVANHIHEYATLKAMGYRDSYLSGVVMQQALAMAVLGYSVSLACAEVLYRVVGYWANLPMVMSWSIRVLVLALSIGMCCASGLATLRKLRAAAPADLF